MDKLKYQYEGIKWLVELELLNHPQVVNTIRFNIFNVSNRIREVELLIYRENRSMLVLLDLTWTGRKFFKRSIFTDVQDVLSHLLPSFRFRITDDPKIMQLAVDRVKQALTGGSNEKDSNPSSNFNGMQPTKSNDNSGDVRVSTSIESSQPEQPKVDAELRTEVSQNNSEEEF